MSIMDTLTFSDQTKSAANTPEARVRGKMLEALGVQIAAAEADAKGETYIPRALRWVTDPDTGDRVRKEVPVRYSKWYWPGEGTKVYLQLRYGNKPLEVKKGKPAIELEDFEALLPTLNQIRDAIVAGEFDTVLMAAKKERALGWTKPKK